MVKAELIGRIAALNSDLPRDTCKVAVDRFFDTMIEQLEDDGAVELRGFGRFFTITKDEVQRRNPRTGAEVTVAKGCRVRFRPGKQMKQMLNPHS